MSVDMSPLQFQKPDDFGAANFVADFQMNILNINDANVLIKKGPNQDKLNKPDRGMIASVLVELWSDTHRDNTFCVPARAIKKCLCFGCGIYLVLCLTFAAVLESHLGLLQSVHAKQIIAMTLGLVSILLLAVILVGMVCIMQQRLTVQKRWRILFIKYVCCYMLELKDQFPGLTFTIIYPMPIYSKRITGKSVRKRNETDTLYNAGSKSPTGDEYISEIWCYLRVSEGLIVTSDCEPIYESTDQHMHRDSITSDHSRISGITGLASGFSLQIEDDFDKTNMRSSGRKTSKNGNLQTGRFPILAAGYKRLT